MLFRTFAFAIALTASGVASAERFCYYWVNESGTVDTYETPPVDLSAPPFGDGVASNGYLIIGVTKKSCRSSQLLSVATQVVRAPARDPVIQPGANVSSGIAPVEPPPAVQVAPPTPKPVE